MTEQSSWDEAAAPRYLVETTDDDQQVLLIPIGERGSRRHGAPNTIAKQFRELLNAKVHLPAVIVLGEAGSGRSTLLRSFVAWIDLQPRLNWCRVDCDIIDPEKLYDALGKSSPGVWDEEAVSSARFGAAPDPEAHRVVLLEHLNHYDDRWSNLIATRLRGRFEADQDFELVIVGDDPLVYEQERAFSTIASVSDLYRLPWWNASQIERAMGATSDAARIAETCIKWTGGQRTLTQLFLKAAEPLDIDDIDDAGEQLTREAPPIATRWKDGLRHLCRDEERREVTRALVRGQTFRANKFPSAGYPLFLAGWIKWSDEEGWHMPLCQRDWARRVVLETK